MTLYPGLLPSVLDELTARWEDVEHPVSAQHPDHVLQQRPVQGRPGPQHAAKHWTEVSDAGKKLTKKDQRQVNLGRRLPLRRQHVLGVPVAGHRGGAERVQERRRQRRLFQRAADHGGLQFLLDLAHKDRVMQQGTVAWATLPTDFASGKVGMIYHSTGSLTSVLAGAKFQVGTALCPAGKQPGTPTGGGNLYLFKASPEDHQAAAWKFVQWLTHARARSAMDEGHRLRGPAEVGLGHAGHEGLHSKDAAGDRSARPAPVCAERARHPQHGGNPDDPQYRASRPRSRASKHRKPRSTTRSSRRRNPLGVQELGSAVTAATPTVRAESAASEHVHWGPRRCRASAQARSAGLRRGRSIAAAGAGLPRAVHDLPGLARALEELLPR